MFSLRLNLLEFKKFQGKIITIKFNVKEHKKRVSNRKANGYKREVNSYD